MATRLQPTPRYCIQHSRFTKQDGWRLWDLSLSLNGNIAVTGYNRNTHRTYIDVYTKVRHSDSRDKPKIIYSKEFDVSVLDGFRCWGRKVSFYPGSDTTILSGLGDKLEVIDLIRDLVIKSRKMKLVNHGGIRCLSVRETEIFIGFRGSNKITVYDVVDLNEIKSIILQGICDGDSLWEITAASGKLFCCVGRHSKHAKDKSLIFEEKSGRILSELTKPTYLHRHADSITIALGVTLGAVVWHDFFDLEQGRVLGKCCQIVFYSLLSENNCSFLIVEVEFGVTRIRIPDGGDRMITGNSWTGEVKVYDMAEVFTYIHFKDKLASTLQTDECTKLANFFKIPYDQTDAILSSDRPSENLFLGLEEKNILQTYNVERLVEAFEELTINPFCRHVGEIFLKTRSPAFYTELIQELEKKISMVQTAFEDEKRQLKEKTTEVEELRKQQETHLKLTQERDELKAERNKGQLQLSFLQEELEASKNARAETERVLKQTEELLQKIIQEKHEIQTELKQVHVAHSLRSMSFEEGRKNQGESEVKVLADMTYATSPTTSPVKRKYLSELLLGEEFAKLLVKVAQKLNNSNCVMMAAYFNLPQSKLGFLQKESDTSGIELLHILKERNIINMYDVTQLQEVLSVLHLVEVNETLVIPYQNLIDPSQRQINKVTRK